jgi:hypothetical protein
VRPDNQGRAAARDHGLRLAHGGLITFLDIDDIWANDRTAKPLAAFAGRPELDMCKTHAQNSWAPELEHNRGRLEGEESTQPQPGQVCQCLMARRTVFDRVGVFDEKLRVSEDTDWLWRAERGRSSKRS